MPGCPMHGSSIAMLGNLNRPSLTSYPELLNFRAAASAASRNTG